MSLSGAIADTTAESARFASPLLVVELPGNVPAIEPDESTATSTRPRRPRALHAWMADRTALSSGVDQAGSLAALSGRTGVKRESSPPFLPRNPAASRFDCPDPLSKASRNASAACVDFGQIRPNRLEPEGT